MTTNSTLTSTELLSAAKETLTDSGFLEVKRHGLSRVDAQNYKLFEDPYSLVAIVVFETWSDLLREWAESQTSFVELISDHVTKDDAKSWDCYLLLWTPDSFPPRQAEERQAVTYNTGRVRKLIATGTELCEIADVATALLPLLPITETNAGVTGNNVLDRLPSLLATEDLPEFMIRSVAEAFESQEPLLTALHKPTADR